RIGLFGKMRISLVKTSSGGLNAVEIIHTNGKTVRKQITMITRWIISRPRLPLRLALLDRRALTILAIVDVPFDELELDPGEQHGGEEENHRHGTGRANLEVLES